MDSTERRDDAASTLDAVLDSSLDAVLFVDGSQRIVRCSRSAEAVFGWAVDSLPGRPLALLLPDVPGTVLPAVADGRAAAGTTARRIPEQFETAGRHALGGEFPARVCLAEVRGEEGRLCVMSVRDLSAPGHARMDLIACAAKASAAREQEKARVARELHDELAQRLASLAMDIAWLGEHLKPDPGSLAARKLGAVGAGIGESIATVRRIATDLRPPILDDLGLEAALRWLADAVAERAGIQVDASIEGDLAIGEPYATAVFRIVQECLANVAKHACAGKVQLRIGREGDALIAQVRDDGNGFAVDAARKPGSLGIVGVRERAELLQGDVRIDSEAGRGTTVTVRIPGLPGAAPGARFAAS